MRRQVGRRASSPRDCGQCHVAARVRRRQRRRSELDHRDVEAALGELALDAIELVGVVVGAEPHAVAHALVRQRRRTAPRPPSRRTRGAPSGSRRRLRWRTIPPAARSDPPLSAPSRCRSAGRSSALASVLSAALSGVDRALDRRLVRRRLLRRLSPGPSAPRRPAGSCRNRSAASRRRPVRPSRFAPGSRRRASILDRRRRLVGIAGFMR